ncbi:MAG TPA: DUF3800 domain-containing protein [Thermomicrobiales bacterium]|nr:DUF3800 domain-containing protein [Thermomicrobiales bacterium]
MDLRYLFLDESGNLDFTTKGTRYFTLTSVMLVDCGCGNELIELRRMLAWEGINLVGEFHATEDYQHVRDRVFDAISRHELRIDATIIEKREIAGHLRSNEHRFYKQMLYLHLKHVVAEVVKPGDSLLVVCAALGTRRDRELHRENLRDVIDQIQPSGSVIRFAFWPAAIEPCLQVADYCSWAIHRKWERRDERSYVLIADKIATEFDLFSKGEEA